MKRDFYSPSRLVRISSTIRTMQILLVTWFTAIMIMPQHVWACACSEVAISPSTSGSELKVDSNSGALQLSQEDIDLPGYAGVNLTRTYDSNQNGFGMFGYGWSMPWVNNLINASGDIRVNVGGLQEVFYVTNGYYNATHGMRLSYQDADNIVVESQFQQKWYFTTTNLACTKYVDRLGNEFVFDTTVTNRLASVQGGTNIYQKVFLINRIAFPDSREMAFEYTSNLCTRAISPDGRTNEYSYTDGLLTAVSRNDGLALDYGYHTENNAGVIKGWLTSLAYANGAEVNIAYNGEFDTTNDLRVVEVTGPHSYIHSYGYQELTNCGCSLVTTLTDSRNNSTVYLSEGIRQRVVTNALGYAVTTVISNGVDVSFTDYRGNARYYVYDFAQTNLMARRNVLAMTNALGKVWDYGYNTDNLRIRSVSPLGQTNSFAYDAKGNVLAATNALGQQVACFSYTTNGLLFTITDAPNNTTTFARNMQGLVTNMVDALTNAWTRDYDASGNPVRVADPLGNVIQIGYNSMNKPIVITNALGQMTRMAYNEMANLTNVTDALNNSVAFTYDQLQRTTKIRDALGNETKFSYDPESKLTVLSNALGHAYSYTFDPVNQTKTFVYPDASKESYVYDPNGNMTVLTNRSGQVVTAEYDAGNRLTTKTWEGTTNVVFSRGYDDANRILTVVRIKGGVVESAITNTWDAANRLTQQSQGACVVSYGYDAAGNATNISYPSGLSARYGYDLLNRVSAIRDSTNAVAAASCEFDAAGRPTKLSVENSTEAIYAWDAGRRITNIVLRASSAPTNILWSAAYGYDAVGNRLWVKNKNGRGDVYQYDATYQVTGVKYDVDDPSVGYASATNPSRTVTYNWDALGNRTSIVDNGNATSYSINNLNQYASVGGTNLTYDTRGNLTGDGVWTFGYDHANHLVSASKSGTTASYAYDGLGRRISKTVNGATSSYIYSGPSLIEERDGSGTVQARYVYEGGIDRPLKVLKGANTYYFQQDSLGNVVALVNTNGQVVEQYTYDIFGAPTIKDGSGSALSSASTPFLFTGREWDAETGLYHYRARAYSSALGRFLQADPIDFNGGNNNIYNYCAGNPVRWIDPLGLRVIFKSKNQNIIKKANAALDKAADNCNSIKKMRDDPDNEVVIWLDEDVSYAEIGNFEYSTIDWSDVDKISSIVAPEGIVAHEVAEQWSKQVTGDKVWPDVHSSGLDAEACVTGNTRSEVDTGNEDIRQWNISNGKASATYNVLINNGNVIGSARIK